jgi:hypothetical protein
MTSNRQIEANRMNAKRSTGPNTAAGKERASGNALRHRWSRRRTKGDLTIEHVIAGMIVKLGAISLSRNQSRWQWRLVPSSCLALCWFWLAAAASSHIEDITQKPPPALDLFQEHGPHSVSGRLWISGAEIGFLDNRCITAAREQFRDAGLGGDPLRAQRLTAPGKLDSRGISSRLSRRPDDVPDRRNVQLRLLLYGQSETAYQPDKRMLRTDEILPPNPMMEIPCS